MSRRVGANSAWIQSSFGDFAVPSKPKSPFKNNSNIGSTSSLPKRRKVRTGPTSSAIVKTSEADVDSSTVFNVRRKVPRSKCPSVPENQNYLDKYSPKCVGDLAVHYRKLQDLRKWFEKFTSSENGTFFLVVTGPSGCGKTSTVRTLAKEFGIEIYEWTNPTHWKDWNHREDHKSQLDIVRTSQLEEFSSFLMRRSRVSVLDVDGTTSTRQKSNRCSLVIVKEIPYEFYEQLDKFRDALVTYKKNAIRTNRCGVVFIISAIDGNSGNSGANWRRLFSTKLQEQLQFDSIEFNPVAATLLTKALRRIIDEEHLSITKQRLDDLVITAEGDLRFAINELQFLHSGHGPSKDGGAKASRRDSSLLLFRALGRCLYSKRNQDTIEDDSLPAHLQQRYQPHPLDFDPELTVESTGVQPSMFTLFLDENVLDFCSGSPNASMDEGLVQLESLSEMFNAFSQIDLISSSNFEERDKMLTYERSIAPRTVAFYGASFATKREKANSYKPMRRPQWLDTWKKISDQRDVPRTPRIHVQNGSVFISEYCPFSHSSSPGVTIGAGQSLDRRLTKDGSEFDQVMDDDDPAEKTEPKIDIGDYLISNEIDNLSIEEYDD